MRKLKPNLYLEANFLSRIFYWWLNGFFAIGSKKTLEECDMFEVLQEDKSEEQCTRLEKNWKCELEKRDKSEKPSLLKAIVKTYASKIIMIGFVAFAEEVLRIAIPILIGGLVSYFEHATTTPVWVAYSYAAGISVCSILLAIINHQYFYWAQRIGWNLRVSACALMYKKTLRLSQKSLARTTTGHIVNLGATDVIMFDFVPMFLHHLWLAPLQSTVGMIIVWREVGGAVLAGVAILILATALQASCGRPLAKLRARTAELTDKRVRFMNEVINGIRIIKMYAWEKYFSKLVSDVRRKEIRKILQSSALRAVFISTFAFHDKALTFSTLAAYVLMGGSPTTSQVFTVMGIYGAMKLSIAGFFIQAVRTSAEAATSVVRIQEFLLLDEIAPKDLQKSGEPHVTLENFTGKWNSVDEKNHRQEETLSDITIRVDARQLFAVVGPVGAGKSSLLNAILGELPTVSGSVSTSGEIAYANQTPWVFSGTIRENILFGEEFDPSWYKKVITACCLTKDLNLLAEGDTTLVGERGVTLSGGQRARVSLARAAYRRRASIYLMDDPLSAVDPAVAKHIFTQCISKLMKNKIRVLVTHHLPLLKSVDKIIILKEGKIAATGTYDELQAMEADFFSFLREKKESNVDGSSSEGEVERQSRDEKVATASQLQLIRNSSTRASVKSIGSEISFGGMPLESYTETASEELREQGSIGIKVYLEYCRVGANAFILFIYLLVAIASNTLYVLTDWWLAYWVQQHETFQDSTQKLIPSTTFSPLNTSSVFEATTDSTENFSSTTIENSSEKFDDYPYLHIYAVFCATMIVMTTLRGFIHFYIFVMSGVHMHSKMFRGILRAPIRFFDTNPAGRILNRFSKDTGQVDELLPSAILDFLFVLGVALSIVILVSIINYFIIIITIALFGYFLWLRRYYMRTSRDIKRLEGTCRSPVFSQLSSTLQGLTTVRAFRVQEGFERRFHENQDLHSASWFLFLVGSRWFGLRLDLITAIFTSGVAFTCVVAASILGVDSGDVGLILTMSASTIGLLQWGVRQSAEVENLMTSVERIQQYYRISPEAPYEIPAKKPPKEWPAHGEILFQNVSFAYYENGPVVLKNVNITIKPKEKIGLVGRTGAGKSSLISTLFRLAELVEGEIWIDGVSTSSIGLRDLRSAISIIPQDPVLFIGTLRRNLNPFDEYTDDDLWNALEQVQLKEFIKSMSFRLETEISESGSNFSAGQRQLVCLARAILQKSKILLIDEATANVDMNTDRLIQATIREKFEQCTVITIAHRINTVVDSDRVLVLDSGRVVEFGEPHILLQRENGHFAKMVGSAGIA